MTRYVVVATHSVSQPELEAQAASSVIQFLDADLQEIGHPMVNFGSASLAAAARDITQKHPTARWVWSDTTRWYRRILEADAATRPARPIAIQRAHDLRLTRNLLRFAANTVRTSYIDEISADWHEENHGTLTQFLPENDPGASPQETLFEPHKEKNASLEYQIAELRLQFAAIPHSPAGNRLRMLIAAESAGAIAATEMGFFGLPWNETEHKRLLEEALGTETPHGQRPPKLQALAEEITQLLYTPSLNPDSPQDLVRALQRNGIPVNSTSKWELKGKDHPVIEPLLRYKKMYRLYTANGWHWLKTWVRDGRFHPEYVVGGVITGRWASRGGGALQIPRGIREAVLAEPGWKLVVADASQLEPRILAAMSRDEGLSTASRGKDLYESVAEQGFGGDRAHAKVAMLGAMYGATTGESARLMPTLRKLYPTAIAALEKAARSGEQGGVVSTHLGRTTPAPGPRWLSSQQTSTQEEQARAGNIARTRGRYTRNFLVQGSAAEWALMWIAELRRQLATVFVEDDDASRPELVFFLHDEIMVHTPERLADRVHECVLDAAAQATRWMFGDTTVEFPLTVAIVDRYSDAK
ncbi:bifunctional 3'-5' exonuclease/DNA polymerase [Neomicrococcus aestuarii]|uniref:DNA-directed DNA polymerase n=1 Tax=Neomicrococcus aestuarii TaxID=556325 RepID=A0A1L2ZPS0_9MICC|nr:bifunctional 3'-5' exonuclease/DNA polymerase [Neomicrococcus aestuarii]APF41384.1 bifunctional 3'-5' exonuclease/DNA polymerase [Neomicrococcus aestuarii]MBB5513320.1 DNA polymerase-1 [Neomicrococcus aestuarii]